MTSTTTEATGHRTGGTPSPGRRTWALWGAAAGVLGVTASMLSQPVTTEAQRAAGVSVMDVVGRGSYHVGAVTGFLAVAALLVYASGWLRLASRELPGSIAARVVGTGLVASAGALVLAYGVKGQLAVYLDGGINQGDFPDEALYTFFVIDDLAGFFGWWGAVVAAAALAWLAFRERAQPRWIGAVSALVALAAVAMLAITGLTGFAGVVSGPWLVITGIGLALQRPPG